MKAIVRGSSDMRVTFLKDDHPIADDMPDVRKVYEDGVCLVTVHAAQLTTHAGEWTCVAESALGTDITRCYVTVVGMFVAISIRLLSFHLTEQETEPASSLQSSAVSVLNFTVRLPPVETVIESTPLTLRATVVGQPSSVVWTRNETVIHTVPGCVPRSRSLSDSRESTRLADQSRRSTKTVYVLCILNESAWTCAACTCARRRTALRQ
jgi:hypothetical protein